MMFSNSHCQAPSLVSEGEFSLDLIKIQHLFANGKIKGAIYIVLTYESANKVAENLTNFETLENEINVFKETITCPILLIGLQ